MKIAILGAGTWGTAIAVTLVRAGHDVTLRSHSPESAEGLRITRTHPKLKGAVLPDALRVTSDLAAALHGAEAVFFAVSSPHVRHTAREAAALLSDNAVLVSAAKGLEKDSLLTMTDVIADELAQSGHADHDVCAFTGPTHAEEVIIGMPTSIICACANEKAASLVQHLFAGTCIRPYTHTDVPGVQLCGAMKNIIALATGIACGLGYGDNTKAALMTRGMAEITRLGLAMGCMPQTFAGLAGIGDLIVTATSMHSRNNRAGMLIGGGMKPDDAVREIGMVVEGMNALPAALQLAQKYGIEMPITETLSAIISGSLSPAVAVAGLMSRRLRSEI